jgi:hypothetical protein
MSEKTIEEQLLDEVKSLKESFEAKEKVLEEQLKVAQEKIKALEEQPKTQGIITEDKPKYGFSLKTESKAGKKVFYAKDARNNDGTWIY